MLTEFSGCHMAKYDGVYRSIKNLAKDIGNRPEEFNKANLSWMVFLSLSIARYQEQHEVAQLLEKAWELADDNAKVKQ